MGENARFSISFQKSVSVGTVRRVSSFILLSNKHQQQNEKKKKKVAAAAAPTNISSALSQLQLNRGIQRASDAAKTKAGFALAAAEQVPATAADVANGALSSVLGAGYPDGLNKTCLQSSFEYAQAFDKGETRCVSPCLFGRFPDTASDPVRLSLQKSPREREDDFVLFLCSLFLSSSNLFFPLSSRPARHFPSFHPLTVSFAHEKRKKISSPPTPFDE